MNVKTQTKGGEPDDFAGFARGWFVICYADELEPGGVRSMRYFGQKLVAFRTREGEPHVLDAYCPHLGADLGVGGEVVKGSIRCPFHHWRFDGSGACVDVPYARKIPPKARLRSWIVRERNGLLFVWHDPEGGEPDYEIPVIEEYGQPDWSPWTPNLLPGVKTQPKEVMENIADKGHFPRVHGTHVDAFDNEFDGHIAVQRTSGVAYPRGGGKDYFSLTATYYGPAYMITEMDSFLKNKLLLAHTPIDEHSLDLRFGVMLQRSGDSDKDQQFAAGYAQNLKIGFEEDIAIWENKLYRSRPMLCDGDGPIGRLRKWYKAFYTPRG